jgi:hypothetical protein
MQFESRRKKEAGVALIYWWRNNRFSYFKDGIIRHTAVIPLEERDF